LYDSGGKIVGGLGISGDTACTDHEIAKRVRDEAGMNPPGGASVDDISYSSTDGASVFTHPLCPNTYRNGVFIGHEAPASDYQPVPTGRPSAPPTGDQRRAGLAAQLPD